jgi:hypothetical protein
MRCMVAELFVGFGVWGLGFVDLSVACIFGRTSC